jgi:hypothetical protein
MSTNIIKTRHHTVHVCLAMLLSLCWVTGCRAQVRPDRSSSGTPLALTATPQALVVTTSTSQPAASPAPSAAPGSTAQSESGRLSDDALLDLFTTGISRTRAMTMSQFSMQYPADGFLKAPTRKQMGTAAAAQNPFLTLFPELRDMPAPAWLKEGMRVTYHVMSASVAQKGGKDGSAGEGYNQYDLVALEDGAAVSSSCLFNVFDGAIMPSLVTRLVDLPGAGDYWINPAVLKDAEHVANDTLAVYHAPYKLGDETYQATRFEYKQDDAEYVWVFDEESGLMLFYRHNLGSDDSDYRQMAQVTLERQRQLKLPWRPSAKATLPTWARKGTKLNYEGTYGVILPNTPTTPLALSIVAQIVDRHQRWLDWQLKTTIQYQTPSISNRATGMVQPFDAYWLPADAIKSLKNGQVIDRDPVTGAKISASRGQGVVSLTESNDSFRTVLSYDTKTGKLVSVQQDSTAGAGTIHIELQLNNQ